jgi:hypothetical protein
MAGQSWARLLSAQRSRPAHLLVRILVDPDVVDVHLHRLRQGRHVGRSERGSPVGRVALHARSMLSSGAQTRISMKVSTSRRTGGE